MATPKFAAAFVSRWSGNDAVMWLNIATAVWRYIHDAILAALPEAAVRSTRITPFGVTYEVVAMVDGLNGATKPVVTTWIIEGDGPPRLTSTWVDIP